MKPNDLTIKDNILSVVLLTLFYLVSYAVYSNFDPDDMRVIEIFPWDASEYRRIAEQINLQGLSNLEGLYPLGPRLLYPLIYTFLQSHSPLSYIESAAAINVFSGYIVSVFTFLFLCRNGISRFLAFLISASYILFWLGPLRYSLYYPGGGFGFESLLICILFLVLTKARLNFYFLLLGLPVVFLLAIGREITFYIVCLTLGASFSLQLMKRYGLRANTNMFVSVPKNGVLMLLFLSSFLGNIISKVLVKDIGSGYSTLGTIWGFGWFHLHLGEFLYPFFYALGPIFLFLITCLVFPMLRRKFVHKFTSASRNNFIILVFAGSAVVFAMVGGTDSDRFILWFFPFFALFGAHAFTTIFESLRPKKTFSVLVIIISLLWTRFYVPAIPHVFFPGDFYNAYTGVRSNLSPNLFYGPPIMERFRLPLQQLSEDDMYKKQGLIIDKPELIAGSQASISTLIEREFVPGSFYKGSYAYELNHIPFPLGFPHNQFELLVAHPYHGATKVKAVLLFQWLTLFGVLCFFIIRFPSTKS